MEMADVVRQLELGNSVAEFDEALEKYFVETEPFRALVSNRADIVAGDKGTGKTAIFRILRQRYAGLPKLKHIEVLPAFNFSGNPVFQRLAHEQVLTEAQYISVWKAYVLSLVGNWLLEISGSDSSETLSRLDVLLQRTGLRSGDDAPATVFSKLVNAIKKFLNPATAGVELTFSETGIPIVTPKVEFGERGEQPERTEVVPHEEALRLLDDCMKEMEVTAWVALDRLDEAFQGFPAVEVPALRALFRTYLDLLEFEHLRLKLFVRRDLFRKITKGGFVNLTHMNARKVEIVWDEEDLLNLLCRRIRERQALLDELGLAGASNVQLFARLVPEQIDPGERRPTSWKWIMSRIRDGNDIKPPRNLIDLVSKSREAQLRSEDREPREYSPDHPIITAESIRRGLTRLSAERVEDTLLAEAGDAAPIIERFRGGKSEYDDASLAAILGAPIANIATAVKPLVDIGFLEPVGGTYKVPMLYRDGLEIIQGKAF
jgi:hypothetical protein